MTGIPKPRNPKSSHPKSEEEWLRQGAAKPSELNGNKPKKTKRIRVTVGIPEALYSEVVNLINKELTSPPLSHWIVAAIKEKVERETDKDLKDVGS